MITKLEAARRYAACGWPVFPCLPGSKQPATRHGLKDAITDPDKISWWWRKEPDRNVAIATGLPGPDVLDVDRKPGGSGFAAFNRLKREGLLDGGGSVIATPSGGFHVYFAGSQQRSGRLPGHHLDFRGQGGYVVAPPSEINGRPYAVAKKQPATGHLDWSAVTRALEPGRAGLEHCQPGRSSYTSGLARWLSRKEEGSRNDALFWAGCRAVEAGHADLSELADAARQTGLSDPEIIRTLDSARHHARPSERETEAG